MWTTLGFPLCSVVFPVWMNATHALPSLLHAGINGHASLCDKAMKLKEQCFPIKRGQGENYINIHALVNRSGTGILQKLSPVDKDILKKSKEVMETWRQSRMNDGAIRSFYELLDRQISDSYMKLFGI